MIQCGAFIVHIWMYPRVKSEVEFQYTHPFCDIKGGGRSAGGYI